MDECRGSAWHQGALLGHGEVIRFQLWVPMPPQIEDGPSLGQYVALHKVPVVEFDGGRVRVLLGSFGDGAAAVVTPSSLITASTISRSNCNRAHSGNTTRQPCMR